MYLLKQNTESKKMKLEVVSGLVSLVGKNKERAKIKTTLNEFHNFLFGEEMAGGFDSSSENCDYVDIGFAYSKDEWTVADLKWQWKQFKKAQ